MFFNFTIHSQIVIGRMQKSKNIITVEVGLMSEKLAKIKTDFIVKMTKGETDKGTYERVIQGNPPAKLGDGNIFFSEEADRVRQEEAAFAGTTLPIVKQKIDLNNGNSDL